MKIHPAAVPANDSSVNAGLNLHRERRRPVFLAALIGVAALFGAITFTAADAAAGDLVIENLTRSPSSVIPGGSTTVSYRIANRGTTTVTPTYTDRIYLSTNNTLETASDVLLGTSHGHTTNLAVNGTHKNSQTVTIPGGTAAGGYFILVQADALEAIAEENEGNNVRAVSLTVGSKDLRIENLGRSPAGVPPGGSTTVSYNVVNRGTATVTETYTDRIYLSTNSTFEPADDVLLGSSHGHTADLVQNATHANSQPVAIPSGTAPGNYFILVQADALGAVAESDEGNNLTAVSLTVNGSVNLAISDVWTTGVVPNRATINWITNDGATSRVEYGTSEALGQTSPLDETLLTKHVITLTDLTPATLYHYRVLSQNADGDPVESEIQTFNTASSHVFEEFNSRVVIEAEHYDAKTPRNGQDWVLQTSQSGYAGSGFLQALPNTGTTIDTDFVTTSPEAVYNVEFKSTGTFYVWIRGSADSTSDDTVHAGIDGASPATGDRINGFPTGWGWKRTTLDGPVATISVPTAGLHTFHLWMRADGMKVDRIVIRKSSSSSVPGQGAGPPETNGLTRVMPVGDSITEGVGDTDFGYRDHLEFLLGVGEVEFVGTQRRPASHPVYDVDHEGLGGKRTDHIETRLPGTLNVHMPVPNPAGSRLLLHIGTNDLHDGVPIADAVDNVEDIINIVDAHDPSINVYVALIIPKTVPADDAAVTDYNNALETRLTTLQAFKPNLFIVDMNSAFKQNPFWQTEYMADTLHPNDLGYQVMAQTWADSIAASEP